MVIPVNKSSLTTIDIFQLKILANRQRINVNWYSISLLYAEKVLDHNHDGLISVSEASKNPTFNSLGANFTVVLETINANGTKRQSPIKSSIQYK